MVEPMVKELRSLLLLLVGSLLILSGCREQEEIKILELSSSSLELTAERQEVRIDVRSSHPAWEAMAEASWVQVYHDDSYRIRLEIEPNTESYSRQTKVKVFAPDLIRELEISQAGISAEARLIPAEVAVDQFGGAQYFYVETNIKDWVVRSDADWVVPTANYSKRRVELVIGENEAREAREAKISILPSTDSTEPLAVYTVRQEGLALFILPYMQFLSKPYEIQAFEKKRKSQLVKVPDGFVNATTWGFTTRSPLFPSVEYTVSNNQYIEARLYPVSGELLLEPYLPRVIAFLESQGFLHYFQSVYVHPDFSVEATIIPPKASSPNAKPHILFSYIPPQPGDQPTFEQFPYGFLETRLGDEDKIREYEASIGGVYDPTRSTANDMYFIGQSPWVYRGYFLKDRQTVQVFDDYRYAYYLHKGVPYLTREFRRLLHSEGFELVAKIDWINLYKYRNTRKNLFMDIWVRDERVGDKMQKVMRINMHPQHD